jgi:hypothetical protein
MMEGTLVYIHGENQHRFELSLPLSIPGDRQRIVAHAPQPIG